MSDTTIEINTNEWEENNINIELFNEILNDISNKKPNSEKNFIFKLENEWSKYKKFTDDKIEELLQVDSHNKNHIMDIVRINDFIFSNKYEINKIIKTHDKISDYKIYPSWRWKINYDNSKKLYPILKNISNLYQDQNNSEESKLKTNDFARKSSKYWVRRDKLIPIILNIIENLPIFIWDEEINDHIYQHIYSVYLDNKDCDMYNRRIDKENKSKLIRFRWYEDNMDNIFVERKVHYDDWTLLESKKNRFELSNQHVLSYLKNDMVIDNSLAKEISEEIFTNKLYPKIRTEYKRISFQLPNNNNVRISIDIDLKLIREKVTHLDWFTPEENLLQDDFHFFPFHILEVKLVGDYIKNPPEWVKNIINSDLVISQPFFSKFLHGSYIFFNDKCKKKPYWIEQNEDLFESSIRKNVLIENQDNDRQNINRCFDICIPIRNRNKTLSTPMKIEPKSYFANERTYLQWFNGSAFVASAGTALMSMKEKETGIILISMSVLVLMYSTVIYHKRGVALENHVSTGYNDKFGPYFLTFIMASAFITSAFIIN